MPFQSAGPPRLPGARSRLTPLPGVLLPDFRRRARQFYRVPQNPFRRRIDHAEPGGRVCRDILTAAILGAGPVADAFFVALKLPNFFRRLFAEGAFTVSFVPMFSAYSQGMADSGAGSSRRRRWLLMVIQLLLPFVFELVAAVPWLMHALAPGFCGRAEKFALAVDFARMTFPYLLLISLVALLGGVLNSLERFGLSPRRRSPST